MTLAHEAKKGAAYLTEKRDKDGKWTDDPNAADTYHLLKARLAAGDAGPINVNDPAVARSIRQEAEDHPALPAQGEPGSGLPAFSDAAKAFKWDEMFQRGALNPNSSRTVASFHTQCVAQLKATAWGNRTGTVENPDDPTSNAEKLAAKAWIKYQEPDQYQNINAILRGHGDGPPRQKNVTRALVSLMFTEGGTTTNAPVTLYRALHSNDQHNWAKELKPGSTFTDDGIISTTAEGKFALGWLSLDPKGNPVNAQHPDDVMMEIQVPKGQRIMGGTTQFIETMLPPHTKFQVVSSERRSARGKAVSPMTGQAVQSSPSDPGLAYTHVIVKVVP